ncbi:MAG: NAD(P)H-dependent oxidoreductase [Candidatus Saccharimonas sp.]
MAQIVILTGSARPNSAGAKLVGHIEKHIAAHADVLVKVVDVAELQLPFFDAAVSPSSDDYSPPHATVVSWTKTVDWAHGFLLLVPEYNGSVTAVQKNAIDWVYKEWGEKPVALVGYGWYGGARAIQSLHVVLETVKATELARPTKLTFMKELSVDGEILDEAAVNAQLTATVDELLQVVNK